MLTLDVEEFEKCSKESQEQNDERIEECLNMLRIMAIYFTPFYTERNKRLATGEKLFDTN